MCDCADEFVNRTGTVPVAELPESCGRGFGGMGFGGDGIGGFGGVGIGGLGRGRGIGGFGVGCPPEIRVGAVVKTTVCVGCSR